MVNESTTIKTSVSSPVGNLTLASNGSELTGLWLENQNYFGAGLSKKVLVRDDAPIFNETKNWLSLYFSGHSPSITNLPLAPVGSEFRIAVWQMLCAIPYGQTMTYGEIAQKMAIKMGKTTMSSQAIGGAVGHNPIAIIIPCHRVVGAKGNLTGYAGGMTNKIKLLELEGVDTSKFYIP